ncbi:hypothetical protein RE428_32220 [Marinobacter nanhaiticus D15-8W]|uniref:HTH luxR-type domain-containing protein n=1 Tax=Marinobacter nanhaiticus D15-8W TaxID=626887 RepID=N6W9F5_9GAMM|nr:response regulator transcription factor [Marinobacter nanhaiticus]ENO16914.1 hypothetical protein J057_01880 [Marinobacter nanhaiticus D15-8W]BES72204.1 hypothetical protein RE428_32220 [Marinobacter nanhaiticus D15-8W]
MIQTEINGSTFIIDSKGEFTPIEEQTIEQFLKGMTAKDAARDAFRSVDTIQERRKNLLQKTNASNSFGVLSYWLGKKYIRVLVITGAVASAQVGGPYTVDKIKPKRPGSRVEIKIAKGSRKEIDLTVVGGVLS